MGSVLSAVDDGTEYVLSFVEDITGDGDRTDEIFIYDNAYVGPEYVSKDDGFLNRRLAARDVSCCAWIIEDSLEGSPADRYPRNLRTQALRNRTNLLHRLEAVRDLCIVGMVVLLLVETPIWCNSDPTVLAAALSWPERWKLHWKWPSHWSWAWPPWAASDTTTTTASPSEGNARRLVGDTVYNPNPKLMVTTLAPDLGIWVEGFFMVIVTLYFFYEMYWHRITAAGGLKNISIRPTKPRYFVLVMVVMWCDLVYYSAHRQQNFRFSPFCRFALLFCWKIVRRVFAAVWATFREFTNVVFFMVCAICFCAWIMVLVLDDREELIGASPSAAVAFGGEHFGTFEDSVISFFTIMTGAGFPEITMAMIDQFPWTILLFFPFVIFTFYVLSNLTIGIVYEAYVTTMKNKLRDDHNNRTRGLALAFCLLAQPGRNKKDQMVAPWTNFKEVLMFLPTLPKMKRKVTRESLSMLCTAVDDGTDELTFQEFHEAVDIMEYDFIVVEQKSWIMRRCLWDFYSLRRFIEFGRLEFVMNIILGLNFAFIIYESYIDLSKKGNNPLEEPMWAKPLEMLFAVVYVAEVVMKLLVVSVRSYFTSSHNRFDFVMSWVIFVVGMFLVIPYFQNFAFYATLRILFPYLNILRMLRVLRLLNRLERFQDITSCINSLLSVSREMKYLLFINCAFFGTVGVQLFGGKLYSENPLLKDTAFAENGDFDVLNFDDVVSATLAIFCIATSKYKPEYTEAMNKVFPSLPHAGLLFGASFFFLGVLVVFNLFTAFCIQVFFTLKEEESRWSEFALLLSAMREAANDGDLDEEDLIAAGDFSNEAKILKTMNRTEQKRGRVCHVHMPPEIIRAKSLTKVYVDLYGRVCQMRAKTAENVNYALYVDKRGDHGTWGIDAKALGAFHGKVTLGQ